MPRGDHSVANQEETTIIQENYEEIDLGNFENTASILESIDL